MLPTNRLEDGPFSCVVDRIFDYTFIHQNPKFYCSRHLRHPRYHHHHQQHHHHHNCQWMLKLLLFISMFVKEAFPLPLIIFLLLLFWCCIGENSHFIFIKYTQQSHCACAYECVHQVHMPPKWWQRKYTSTECQREVRRDRVERRCCLRKIPIHFE